MLLPNRRHDYITNTDKNPELPNFPGNPFRASGGLGRCDGPKALQTLVKAPIVPAQGSAPRANAEIKACYRVRTDTLE